MIHEPEMLVVEKIFGMAANGLGVKAMQTRLHQEGVPTPTKRPVWSYPVLRRLTSNDVYKPHYRKEIEALVTPKVAAGLDLGKSYGVWWCNRLKVTARTVSLSDGNGGRKYKRRQTSKPHPR